MTLALDSLEQAITVIQRARRDVAWLSHENPVWLTLWHSEQYIAGEFKREFNEYFKSSDQEGGEDA